MIETKSSAAGSCNFVHLISFLIYLHYLTIVYIKDIFFKAAQTVILGSFLERVGADISTVHKLKNHRIFHKRILQRLKVKAVA